MLGEVMKKLQWRVWSHIFINLFIIYFILFIYFIYCLLFIYLLFIYIYIYLFIHGYDLDGFSCFDANL